MLKNRSRLQRIALIFADMLGLYLSLLLILWFLTDEWLFFVNMFVSLMPGIFYLIPIGLIIVLWLRSKHTFILLLLPIITFCWLYIPAWMPRSVEPIDGTRLSLLTYNLRASNTNTDALDELLAKTDADIVSLQEVSVEIADHVEANWADEYPYIIRFTVEDDPAYASQLTLLVTDVAQYSGRLLLSRYPINDQEIVASSVGTTLYIRASITIEEQEVTIYNVHLPPPLPDNSLFSTATRSQNLVTLLDSVPSEFVILIGDFNMSDQSNDYQSVTSQYTDVFRATQSGFGNTWANGNNLSPFLGFVPSIIRIDYIFVSNDITPQSSQVLYEGVSDHYPVYAEVVIK